MTKNYRQYLVLTVDELADILRVSRQTVIEDYIKQGKIYAFKVGRSYRIPTKEIEHLLPKEETV